MNKRTGYKLMDYTDLNQHNNESRLNSKKQKFNHKRFNRIPVSTRMHSRSRCLGCGEIEYWKGDDECLHNDLDGKCVRFDLNRPNSREDDIRPCSYFQ